MGQCIIVQFTHGRKSVPSAQWLKWPGQAGSSGNGGVEGVGNLAHFNMDNTEYHIFINSRGLKPEQGAEHRLATLL